MKYTLQYTYDELGGPLYLSNGDFDGWDVVGSADFEYEVDVDDGDYEEFLRENYGDEWEQHQNEDYEDDFYDWLHDRYEEDAMEWYRDNYDGFEEDDYRY